MEQRVEEQLVALESIDVVRTWHTRIAGRELSFRRANEIASAARQAREYLRNAAGAAHSVRPLLTYYGNAALSRAVVLLLRRNAGEESLVRGHGLETVGWAETLGTDLTQSLASLSTLRIRTTAGLFEDLLRDTDNLCCIHVRSSEVDWSLSYPQPQRGLELTLADIVSRLPDLKPPAHATQIAPQFAWVNDMTFEQGAGFFARVQAAAFQPFQQAYLDAGYELRENGEYVELRCDTPRFEQALPQFAHGYVRNTFGIPSLHLCPPLAGGRLSQIALTFALSFLLGMLTRYFPTHWIAVQSGATGDAAWPTLFAAQRYVQSAYPQLLLEYVSYKVARRADA